MDNTTQSIMNYTSAMFDEIFGLSTQNNGANDNA